MGLIRKEMDKEMSTQEKQETKPGCRNTVKYVLILIGAILLAIIGINVFNLLTNSPNSELLKTAIQVCSGKSINNAAPYDKNAIEPNNLHPIVLINPSNPWWWYQPLTSDYQDTYYLPKSINELQLVACLGKKKYEMSGYCSSYGRDTPRYKAEQDVRIVAAQTGKVIDSFSASKGLPFCEENEQMYRVFGEQNDLFAEFIYSGKYSKFPTNYEIISQLADLIFPIPHCIYTNYYCWDNSCSRVGHCDR
jgi:hypothetical protein